MEKYVWCVTNINVQSIKMVAKDEVWKINEIQVLKMSNKLLDCDDMDMEEWV